MRPDSGFTLGGYEAREVFVLNLTVVFYAIFIYWELSDSWCIFAEGWKGGRRAFKGCSEWNVGFESDCCG